jgi:hypothetical protein
VRRDRDILDYVVLFSGLIATSLTIYFLIDRYKAKKSATRTPIDKEPKDKIGVIIE